MNLEKRKSSTGLVYHPDYLEHLTGAHPESPDRLVAIMQRLGESGLLERVVMIEPRRAREEDVTRVHAPEHVRWVKKACGEGFSHLDPDTAVSERSFDVALLATGGLLAACDEIASGKVANALCLVRPPGHHATRGRAMGFCLFNNVAIAARYLQGEHGIERVLIVDWDLHHGNGTQDIFYDDGSVFYFSAHQSPHYPGTGRREEVGEGEGEGYTLNLPLPAGTGEREYLDAFMETLEGPASAFSPEFVLVSAGFDAHSEDPLGSLSLTERGYRELTEFVAGIAAKHCGGMLLSALEGGYNLSALSRSVETHLSSLMSAGQEETHGPARAAPPPHFE
jgi:acetoin utilization deacetylase AcuC-like enzyme